MNSYRKLADLCDTLAAAFVGGAFIVGLDFTISEDGKYVEVSWDRWPKELDGQRLSELVTEAYYQAFGNEKGLQLRSVAILDKIYVNGLKSTMRRK